MNSLSFSPVFKEKSPKEKMGCINVDVDTMASDLDSQLRPINDMKFADISWSIFMPRILKLFERANIKATFFIIGKHLELPSCREYIKAIVKSGHEIANHTMNHYKHFSLLPKAEIEREIRECHDRLSDISGLRPVGFRAPGYVINRDVISILHSLGYKYDASLNASRFHNLIKAVYKYFIVKEKDFFALQDMRGFPGSQKAHWVAVKESKEEELPLALFPINIIPFLHYTFISGSLINFGYGFTRLAYKSIYNAIDVLNFELHDIEFCDTADMGGRGLKIPYLSGRYARIPMARRETYFTEAFKLFKKDFSLTTFSEIIKRVRSEYCYC